MERLETDSPNLIGCVATQQRYANLARLFGYREISYTEVACAGWYRFKAGVFWLLNVAPNVVEVHISALGVPDKEFFTQELEGAIISEATALGCDFVMCQDIDRRMGIRLRKLGWEQRGDQFWRQTHE